MSRAPQNDAISTGQATRQSLLIDGLIVILLLFLLILPLVLILIVRPAPPDPIEFQRQRAEAVWGLLPMARLGVGPISLHGIHLFFTAIAASILILFLLVRTLRIVNILPAIVAAVLSYVAGCAISVWLFYLVWALWKPFKRVLPRGEMFWEDFISPLTVPGSMHGLKGDIYHYYYLQLPIFTLLVFIPFVYLLVHSQHRHVSHTNTNSDSECFVSPV